jgi:hypothetical protein
MEEYKDLKKDLNELKNKKISDAPIYQIQCINNISKVKIVKVGNEFYTNVRQVLLKEFKIHEYNCYLTSFLYRELDINSTNNFNIIQLKLKKGEDNGNLIFLDFFCEIDKMQTIDLDKPVELESTFGIRLQKDNKQKILNTFKTYPGKDKMLEVLLEKLSNII